MVSATFPLGLHYDHPDRGKTEVVISEHSLMAIRHAFVGSNALQRSLNQLKSQYNANIDVQTWGAALHMIQTCWRGSWILGCSGFATAGIDCTQEGRALMRLYKHLVDTRRKPALVCDGGVEAGVLKSNGKIAQGWGLRTLGCVPYSALPKTDIAFRLYTAIWGATYKKRQKLVGTLPDLLWCIGGGEGTLNECQTAIANGGVALLVSPKPYKDALTTRYQDYPDLCDAKQKGRLFVAGPNDNHVAELDKALKAMQLVKDESRQVRLPTLQRLLKG